MLSNQAISLRRLIASSALSEAQQGVWNAFIMAATEEDIAPILGVVKDDPAALSFLTENLEGKLAVMRGGDKSAWQKIVEKEKEYISNISN